MARDKVKQNQLPARLIAEELIRTGKTLEEAELSDELAEAVRKLVTDTFGIDVFKTPRTKAMELDEIVLKSIDELDISNRALNALRARRVYYIGQLIQRDESEVLGIPGISHTLLWEIKKALDKVGLRLGIIIENWQAHCINLDFPNPKYPNPKWKSQIKKSLQGRGKHKS